MAPLHVATLTVQRELPKYEIIFNLGTPILTIGGMEGPWGITFNQRGEVVVAEWNGNCVYF